MAKELPYHVRSMKGIVFSGVPNSFFDNVFIRDYLANLAPRHRAIYRRTLLRLLRVYVDCQNKEVCTLLGYILTTSFLISTLLLLTPKQRLELSGLKTISSMVMVVGPPIRISGRIPGARSRLGLYVSTQLQSVTSFLTALVLIVPKQLFEY